MKPVPIIPALMVVINFPEVQCCGPMRLLVHELDPLASRSRFLDRFQHPLIFDAIVKSWLHGFAIHTRVHKVHQSVNESMFVANQMSLGPPSTKMGMHAATFRDEDVAKPLA